VEPEGNIRQSLREFGQASNEHQAMTDSASLISMV
jgi:hypothetical protein